MLQLAGDIVKGGRADHEFWTWRMYFPGSGLRLAAASQGGGDLDDRGSKKSLPRSENRSAGQVGAKRIYVFLTALIFFAWRVKG